MSTGGYNQASMGGRGGSFNQPPRPGSPSMGGRGPGAGGFNQQGMGGFNQQAPGSPGMGGRAYTPRIPG